MHTERLERDCFRTSTYNLELGLEEEQTFVERGMGPRDGWKTRITFGSTGWTKKPPAIAQFGSQSKSMSWSSLIKIRILCSLVLKACRLSLWRPDLEASGVMLR